MFQMCNTCADQVRRSYARALLAGLSLWLIVERAHAEGEFVFLLRTRGNPYWNSVAAGIKESAQALGVRASIYQMSSENSAEEQLNTCLTAIERKPAFVAIVAANTAVGIQCLKRATALGARVGEIDSTIPIPDAEQAGLKLDYSVGSDNVAIGRKAAEYAAGTLGGKPAKVLVLEGAVGSDPGIKRIAGFKEELKLSAPQAQIVMSESGEWDRLKAMNITSDALQRFPTIDLIYAANDLMALGAVEALKARGRLSKVRVIGVDGDPSARESIRKGEMAATVAQVPYFLGKRALELAVEVSQGKTVPQREITDTPLLTKEVLATKDSPELRYVR